MVVEVPNEAEVATRLQHPLKRTAPKGLGDRGQCRLDPAAPACVRQPELRRIESGSIRPGLEHHCRRSDKTVEALLHVSLSALSDSWVRADRGGVPLTVGMLDKEVGQMQWDLGLRG